MQARKLFIIKPLILSISLIIMASLITGCNTNLGGQFDLQQMLKYFNDHSYTPILTFIKTLCYLLGFIFFYKALMKIKQFGDNRNMMSSNPELTKAILYIVAGVGLMNIQTLLGILSATVWGTNAQSIDAQAHSFMENLFGGNSTYANIVSNLGNILKLIGIIAFVRGWIQMVSVTTNQSQPGGIPKALAHIIGGLFLYHFEATAVLFATAFGLHK